MRRLAVLVLWVWCCAVAPASAQSAPVWRLEQPAPPAGAPFNVALGAPGSLTFWAPNRGLLGVEGNSVVPRGILAYDGESWHTLSTVCGGPGDTMRIAWAAANEFWTVSEPSRPRQGSGTALCRFKDGQVVGSYSTADTAADPYRQMHAAACRAVNDCWFAGIGSRDPTGTRVGAFHLHWDGASLRTVYNAGSGRAVTDIEATATGYLESSAVGPRRGSPDAPDPPPLESRAYLLQRIEGTVFSDDPFLPSQEADGGTELLALDSDSGVTWAVGGGAASGPAVAARGVDGVVQRPPLVAVGVGGPTRELALTGPTFGPADRFEDVAAVPGTSEAWAALVPFAERGRTNVKAQLARIDARTGLTTVESLPASGSGRGAAARIAFTSPTDGWMVTNAGWLFHYTDGTRPAKDTDPAFAGPITSRPNEAAEQFVPDAPPADDSQRFAPPPVAIEPEPTEQAEPEPLAALIRNVRKPKVSKKLVLSLTFTVSRKARVQLIARRKGKTVAKTKNRTLNKGKHTLKLQLSRKQWPTALRFRTKELTLDESQLAPPSDDTVTTTPTTDDTVTTTGG
ncbi:hypothetical protein DVA67_028935 [Solirubrobacter sp. CPCC 204708]|uniref:Uncharacterized protein n=1 Tax=Solirubrobacter deserti TaxID=2282478 RepID=A0ABT4RTR7_9ACTN|nr:hypothetical protein [Solirubrobacter deserti]MBE2320025.1 hypothetical protein [Solirubrobacter deserti]MDA0141969.1 hypothetical protein [Solirubrobacter deserti]